APPARAPPPRAAGGPGGRWAPRPGRGRRAPPPPHGVVLTVAAFDVADGRVTGIWVVRNPEKLRPWAR
ncbi:hypothetical protein ACFWXO_15195, partial [Kitasatospora sp. NPDC059088]